MHPVFLQIFQHSLQNIIHFSFDPHLIPVNIGLTCVNKFFERWYVHNKCVVSGKTFLIAADIAASPSVKSTLGGNLKAFQIH